MHESCPSPARRATRSLCALLLYGACVGMICSERPVLDAVAAIIAVTAGLFCIRRSRGRPHREAKATLGFVLLVPFVVANLIMATRMQSAITEFVYVCAFVGPAEAIEKTVTVTYPNGNVIPKGGPPELSNGAPAYGVVLMALWLLAFPLFALGMVGLTYLVGTVLEIGSKSGE